MGIEDKFDRVFKQESQMMCSAMASELKILHPNDKQMQNKRYCEFMDFSDEYLETHNLNVLGIMDPKYFQNIVTSLGYGTERMHDKYINRTGHEGLK